MLIAMTFINHDFTLFINYYIKFSKEDKKKCFKLYHDFFKKIEDRIYINDIYYIFKKELLSCVLKDDFKRFDEIANYASTAFDIIKKENDEKKAK